MNRHIYRAIVALTLLTTGAAAATQPADSLVIRFANKTRLVIYAPDKAGIQALSNYDLNKIIREMSMQLDSIPGGETAIKRDGDQYLKDTVLVVTKTRDGMRILLGDSDKAKKDTTNQDSASESSRKDRDYRNAKRRDSNRLAFGFSIGLDNYITQSNLSAYPESNYDLRPAGSRYFALSAGYRPTLIRGSRASLKLYYGVEVAWQNFMFDGNNFAEKTATGVAFPDAGRELQKSKLTVTTISIPFIPRVTFYNRQNRQPWHIGVGVYGSYRLDSYRKIKEADGSKTREHSNFDLNDFRYGAIADVGIAGSGGMSVFVKYDLSPLFKTNLGPDLRAISFGISF